MSRQTPPTTQLTKIKGIGKGVAGRLAQAGVHTVEDLAAADADKLYDELAGMRGLSVEKVQDWVNAARELDNSNERHSGSRTTDLPRRPFVVTVLSSDQRTVTRTMVKAVHDEEVSAGWDGWAPGELIDFIERTCQMPAEIRLGTATTGFFGAGATSAEVNGNAPRVKRPPELGAKPSDLRYWAARAREREVVQSVRPEARLPPSPQGQATSVAASRVLDEAEAEEMLAASDRDEQARLHGLVHRAVMSASSGTR